MKKLMLVLVLLVGVLSRRHHKRHSKKQQQQTPKDATALEEMLMRLRGTMVINYVDQYDKFGKFNRSDPDINGDENRSNVQALQSDSAGRRLRRKHTKKELVQLTSSQSEYKTALDKKILESSHLMMNDVYDPRNVNMFFSTPIELPILCKKTLDQEELVKLAQRAANFTFCWNNASDPEDPQKYTYLELQYLNMEQFQKFFKCATEKTLSYEDKIDQKKYIDTRDSDQMQYPEALYNFVMGKHLPLQPISWLKFALFVCKEGSTYSEKDYLLQPEETGYSDTITDEYKEKMKKLIDLIKKQRNKSRELKMSGIIVSRFRFGSKKGRRLNKSKLMTVDKVYQLSSFKKDKLKKASAKIDNIFKFIIDGVAKEQKIMMRRLKKHHKK